ncbi:kelch repeat-containing protein, partial [Chloroflexota bacterium]
MGVSLGDVDDDGDLDAFVANLGLLANKVWLNNGSGNFTDNGQSLGSSSGYGVSLGDVDGDGDLDAFVANYDAQPNKVWLNDGSGNFTDNGQSLGSLSSMGVSLGDVDGDGDLDAFVVNRYQANKVWLNDGSGNFTDNGQSLGGSSNSYGVSLGDVDGDGDLDAFVVNSYQGSRVWLNNGSGNFTDNGQSLGGSSQSYGVSLGDVDGDGDLDAFVVNSDQANKVWLNDGSGNFTHSGQSLVSSRSDGVSLGDVDGDGDLDAFVANSNLEANRVWLNEPPLSISTNAADNITTISATLNSSLDGLGDYSSANVSFEWGTTSGNLTQETNPQVMISTGNFSDNISSLSSNTTYYFRAKVTGSVSFSPNWTEVTPTSSPPARYAHTMAYDSSRNRIVLFGGDKGGPDLGDTWEYDGTNQTWTEVTPTSSPSARSSHAIVFDSNR